LFLLVNCLIGFGLIEKRKMAGQKRKISFKSAGLQLPDILKGSQKPEAVAPPKVEPKA